MKGYTRESEQLRHQSIEGVVIRPMWGEDTRVGTPQEMLVIAGPGATIPLHTHDTDARMYIVAGHGEILSEDRNLDGWYVTPGTEVYFEAKVPHGFKAGDEGLTFVSKNGGIVDKVQNAWDIQFK